VIHSPSGVFNSQIGGHFVTKTTNVRRKKFTFRTVRCGKWFNDLFAWMSINNLPTLSTLSTVGIPSTATANICRRRKTKNVGF